VKNAPAVTARRATNQIVLAVEHQALAAIVVVILAATAAETLAVVVVVVIVLAEQTVRVVTMRLIDHAVTANVHTRRARLVTAMRAHAVMEHLRIGPAIRVVMVILQPGLRVPVATALTRLVLLVMGILGHRVPVAIVPTRRVLRVMVIHVHVVMAMTAHVSLVAMAIRAAGPHVAMVLHLPGRHGPAVIDPIQRVPLVTEILGLRVPGETVPIRRVPRATARVQIVREANGLTVLARIAQIVHAPIALTATSHAVSGSPMGESVVHFARR
jgi:hypothetical protein